MFKRSSIDVRRWRSLLLPLLVLCQAWSASSSGAQNAQILPTESPEEARRMGDSLFVTGFPIDDGAAEIAVPSEAERNAAPIDFANYLMELAERSDRASQRGDHAQAAKYLRAITLAVPGVAAGFSKLCQAYEEGDDKARGLSACAMALTKPGVVVDDYMRYVRLALVQPGAVPTSRLNDLDAVLKHLEQAKVDPTLVAQLRCDVGVRVRDTGRLRACLETLRGTAPNQAKTLGYEWTLAMQEQDYAGAAQIVERARHSSMKPDAVEVMARVTAEVSSPWQRALYELGEQPLTRWLAVGGLGALLLLVFTLRRLRRAPLVATP
ncbi:MAG: hypothetical protein QM778_28990 [Myxococcales bacterium]